MSGDLGFRALSTLFVVICCLSSPTTTPTEPPTSAATPFAAGAAGVPVSLTIENQGDAADRMLGASTAIAERVEVQETFLVQGRRVMHAAPAGISIPATTTLRFEPGTRHLMLVGLRVPLVQGQTFPVTLQFQCAGEVLVTARVRRKVDAAGVQPIPPTCAGDLCVTLASAPPAPAS